MSSAEIAKNLQQQLAKARQEILNLRKQFNALKYIHRKEMDKIRDTLHNWQCNDCKKREAAAQLANTTPVETKNQDSEFKPIGIINSDFPMIRGTPRQPTITMHNTKATLTMNRDVFSNPSHALQDLDNFSHLWIIFIFHKNSQHPKAKVAPPRLNGVRTGVFATRSPHRPCPIGLSLVKIEKIVDNVIYFTGVDMIDQTPVLDVKPYIPQYDQPGGLISTTLDDQGNISNSNPGLEEVRVPSWIDQSPVHRLTVTFNKDAFKQLQELGPELASERFKIISNVLQEDPRSIYLRERVACTCYTLRIVDLFVECRFNNADHSVEVVKVHRKEA